MDPATKRSPYDVFLSYCGDDDAPLFYEPKGWVYLFFDTLKKRIAVNKGRERRPEIFFDGEDGERRPIELNDKLKPTLADRLHEARVFVAIVSPSYLSSDWCKFELGTFCELKGVGAGIDDSSKSRIFPVIKTHNDEVKQQLRAMQAVKDLPGCHLHDGKGDELRFNDDNQSLQLWQKINDLSKTLLQTLGLLDQRPGNGVTIFIGNGSKDIAQQADALARELEMPIFGHHVIRPPAEPNPDPAAYRATLRHRLSDCRLAIHPIGNVDGSVPEGYDVSPFVMQYQEVAAEAQRRPGELVQLAWALPNLAPAQERQQKFIQELEARGPRLYHKVSLEELKSRIGEMLAPEPTPMQRPPSAPAATSATPAGKPFVYVVCDQNDAPDQIKILEGLLKDDFTVVRSLLADEVKKMAEQEGFEAQFRQDHESNLASCDAVVIYYVAGSQLWLRAKLRELHDAPAFGRQRPFAATALLVTDPERTHEGGYRSDDLLFLDGSGGLTFDALAPFVSEMKRASQRAG